MIDGRRLWAVNIDEFGQENHFPSDIALHPCHSCIKPGWYIMLIHSEDAVPQREHILHHVPVIVMPVFVMGSIIAIAAVDPSHIMGVVTHTR